MSAIVVDIGGTNIRVGGTQLEASGPINAATPTRGVEIISTIEAMIEALISNSNANYEFIIVGCPGLINRCGRVEKALYLDLAGINLKSVLENRFSICTIVDNDANLQAMSFTSTSDTLLYIVFGTGVGGAIVSGGHVFHGGHGFAGEFGHLLVPGHHALCLCGQRGCVDTLASGVALAGRLGEAWWKESLTAARERALSEIGLRCGEVAHGVGTLIDPNTLVVAGHLATYNAFQEGFRCGANPSDIRSEVQFVPSTWPLAVQGARRLAMQAEKP